MYIYAFSNHSEVLKDKLSDKKSMLTKKFNRSDNFINLTLLGAQKCLEDISLNRQTSIFLASRNGNMNTTIKVLDSIFIKDRLPMPFNFLNTVNATKLFFLAKNFEVEGKTLFMDRFESALPQAYAELKHGRDVLLGVVKEAIEDLELHKKKFPDEEEIRENSRWLLLSSEQKDMKPIAEIYDFKLTSTTQAKSLVSDFFSFLESADKEFEFRGENLSFKARKASLPL